MLLVISGLCNTVCDLWKLYLENYNFILPPEPHCLLAAGYDTPFRFHPNYSLLLQILSSSHCCYTPLMYHFHRHIAPFTRLFPPNGSWMAYVDIVKGPCEEITHSRRGRCGTIEGGGQFAILRPASPSVLKGVTQWRNKCLFEQVCAG